jgi:hypothetical protein
LPPPELVTLLETALYWPFLGVDGYGQAVVGPPVQIMVRWNNVYREALNAQSTSIPLDAIAWTNAETLVGSHMWLGTLTEWYGESPGSSSGSVSSRNQSAVYYVKTSTPTKDVKGRVVQRTAGLMRLHNQDNSGSN